MSHPVTKFFNGGGGGGFFESLFGALEMSFEFDGGFSVGELLEGTRSKPKRRQEVFEPPVLAAPVFERTGGEGPRLPSPLEPQPTVSIFSDIVSVFSGPSDVGTGGGGIFGDVLGDIILRQTTSAEERVLGGIGLPGDIAKAIGNIQGDISATAGILGGLRTFTQPGVSSVAQLLDFGAAGGANVAPCPTPGGSSGFPAGSCITLGDWERMGSPRGFEAIGRSGGETIILRKKRRRRRRGGLTKGMMTDVDYLARKLGKPAAETYLNRVL